MVREFADMMGEKPGDPISLLITASMFREDMPWLYELGIEAYRAAKSGLPEEAERTLRRFQRAAEITERGPFSVEELGLDPKVMHMIVRDIRRFLSTAEEESKTEVKDQRDTAPSLY
jgi:hypothetical protein